MQEETPVSYFVENKTVITEEETLILQKAAKIYERLAIHGDVMATPEKVKDWMQAELMWELSEIFGVLWLDNRHRAIAFEKLFKGTIDGTSVHPRELMRAAIKHNAAACILVHNHPSHDATPSNADIAITDRLKRALAYIDIQVLDHIIVGDIVVSMAERDLI